MIIGYVAGWRDAVSVIPRVRIWCGVLSTVWSIALAAFQQDWRASGLLASYVQAEIVLSLWVGLDMALTGTWRRLGLHALSTAAWIIVLLVFGLQLTPLSLV